MRRLAFGLVLLLSACASAPPHAPASSAAAPVPAIPAGKAAVHIYRREIPFGPPSLSIYDGQTPVGALTVGTYLNYYADPGPRSLKVRGTGVGNIPYATSFRAGQDYYLMVYFLGDQDKGDASLAPVDTATAINQMASLKPVVLPMPGAVAGHGPDPIDPRLR
ncbi:MAG TPA: hypothetical protein VGN70_11605 [Gammaproteobacteria bacterium]